MLQGRMENGKESVDLLVEKDFNTALQKAKHINEYNEQRKDIDKQMTEEANQIVSKLESQEYHSSIVLYDENWKKGVSSVLWPRVSLKFISDQQWCSLVTVIWLQVLLAV